MAYLRGDPRERLTSQLDFSIRSVLVANVKRRLRKMDHIRVCSFSKNGFGVLVDFYFLHNKMEKSDLQAGKMKANVARA